jgi:hypothetical protein
MVIGVARVDYELAFGDVTTLDSLVAELGHNNESLTKARAAARGCRPGAAAGYLQRARNLGYAAAAAEIGGALLGWALETAIGYAIDRATQNLVDDIGSDAGCHRRGSA